MRFFDHFCALASALVFNSKLDSSTVSKDCESRCFSWHGHALI